MKKSSPKPQAMVMLPLELVIKFTPEQIEYINDNLLSDSDWEFLGYKKPIIIPYPEVTDDIQKREFYEMNKQIGDLVNNYNFIFKEN